MSRMRYFLCQHLILPFRRAARRVHRFFDQISSAYGRAITRTRTIVAGHAGLVLGAAMFLTASAAPGSSEGYSLTQRHWFEACSTHFQLYSCGPTQDVARLAGRLEQFREAYAVLAGNQAVASPPIIVMAFPDHASFEPFMPLYHGKPSNLAAFFKRGSDENLIALSLSGDTAASLEAIYHEYTHLLLRHNEQFWPIWLVEGMADVYGTFEVTGPHTVRIGRPMPDYLILLKHKLPLSLRHLFSVTHKSPDYNESERQGPFYAQAWLLTHYLMLGDNPSHKARFGRLTALLRQGQSPEQAFTNTFGVSLPEMESELHRYLERGKFQPATFTVPLNLAAPQALATRHIRPAETDFRLGDQLMRVGQLERAESYFRRAEKIAPASPLPYEGLGLLAAGKGEHETAVRHLREALQRGSASFLAFYIYARERYTLLAGSSSRLVSLPPEQAAAIRADLEKSLKLMPDFGPAHHLLGILELLQEEKLASFEPHLLRAIQLEPENPAYVLTLAQAQLFAHQTEAARRTLEPLCLPYVNPEVRRYAEKLLGTINANKP